MTIILIIALGIFLFREVFTIIGSYIEANKPAQLIDPKDIPFVSVVVAARDEEENIARCLKSLIQSDFPNDKYEIIIVDDRSTDRTAEIVKSFQNKSSNIKLKTVTESSRIKNLQGKPGALQTGINTSKGEIILMTDADCAVNPKWIRTMASIYSDSKLGFAAGFTAMKTKGFFGIIQATEWLYLHTMAIAGIAFNAPLSCYGNNVSVRKKDFDNIGGYYSISFSVTEDLALMHSIFKSGKKIRYLSRPNSSVETLPCATIKDYLNQHHRWTIGALDLGWIAVLFVLSSLSVWFGIVYSLITLQPIWLIAFVAARFIGDFLVILPSALRLKQYKAIKWAIPSIFFFVLMELVAPTLLLKRNVSWKKQVFKPNR